MLHWQGDHLAADLGHGAHALFTTRRGGMSEGAFASLNLSAATGDDPARVAANRERVERATGVALRFGRQVHGAHVATDDEPAEEADGQVTRAHGQGVAVVTADCLPVAVASPTAVAMLHAGWRGLAAGVIPAGVEALGPGPYAAAIGPGIGPCCYEVGDEVRAAFGTIDTHLDLKRVAREQLRDAGVATIDDAELCTACDAERFFSHRRDHGRTGRQAGVAWRSA